MLYLASVAYLFLAYPAYILFVALALRRGWSAHLTGAHMVWPITMVVLPAVLAGTFYLLLVNDAASNESHDGGILRWILLGYVLGASLFIVGSALGLRERDSGLPYRTLGWSIMAGITLIPSYILILFVPLAGLVAFWVPPRKSPRGRFLRHRRDAS